MYSMVVEGNGTIMFADDFHHWLKQQDECRLKQMHSVFSNSTKCIKTRGGKKSSLSGTKILNPKSRSLKRWKILDWLSLSPDLNRIGLHSTEKQTKSKRVPKKTLRGESDHRQGLKKSSHWGYKMQVHICGPKTSDCYWVERIFDVIWSFCLT